MKKSAGERPTLRVITERGDRPPWQTAGLFTNSRSMSINGLTPGTTYFFQVRAIGGSTGYSDWSNPASRMCA